MEALRQGNKTNCCGAQTTLIPDHHPSGAKVERRAIQLGMRGSILARYAREWILDIEDISEFVHEQYEHVWTDNYTRLATPREMVYPVDDEHVVARLEISAVY